MTWGSSPGTSATTPPRPALAAPKPAERTSCTDSKICPMTLRRAGRFGARSTRQRPRVSARPSAALTAA